MLTPFSLFTLQDDAIRNLFSSMTRQEYSVSTLITFVSVFFFLAVITYGISCPVGLFVPSILCGAAYGRLVSKCESSLFKSIKSALFTSHPLPHYHDSPLFCIPTIYPSCHFCSSQAPLRSSFEYFWMLEFWMWNFRWASLWLISSNVSILMKGLMLY